MKKFLIITASVLFALLAAAELYVQSDYFAERLRPVVLGPLRQVLGSDAQIGWVRANLIPLYIEARDIALPDSQGKPAAAIRKIKVYINPLPLLVRKVRLPSVTVLEPRIFAERTKDEQINLIPIIDRIRANIKRTQTGTGSGFEVMLQSIVVNNASISFRDRITGSDASVSGIHLSARVTPGRDEFSLSLRSSEVKLAAPAYPQFSGKLKAAVHYDHDRFQIEALDISTSDTVFSLSGRVGSLSDPELDLDLKARSGPVTIGKFTSILKQFKHERKATAKASAHVYGRLSDPQLEGGLQVSGISYKGIVLKDGGLSFRYRNRLLTLLGDKWELAKGEHSVFVDTVQAAVGYSNRAIDIRDLSVRAGDLSLAMSGRVDPQNGFNAVMSLQSKDKGRTLSFLTSLPMEGELSVRGFLTGVVDAPLVDGTVTARQLRVRGILFDSASGRIQYRDRKIELSSVEIHQQASRYLINGSLDLAPADVLIAARLKVIQSDVGTMVSLFYKPLPLHFSASGDLVFNGTVKEMSGNGRLSLDAGSAYEESFTKGTITAVLTKDRITFPQVVLAKGSGTIQGSGWIGFDGTYSASIHSRGVKLGEVQHLGRLPVDGASELSIESSGTFSAPVVTASAQVDDLLVNQTAIGKVTADVRIGQKVLTAAAKFSDGRAGFKGRMSLSKPYAWTVDAGMHADSFDPFAVTGKKELTGRVSMGANGTISVRGRGADPSSITGTAVFDQLHFAVGEYRVQNSSPASLSISGSRLTIGSLDLNGQGTSISVAGGAHLLKDVDLSFLGTANLTLLRPLFRDLEYSNGTAEVKLTARDDWSNPDVSGEVTVRNGELKIRDIPQKFSALNGKLTFDRTSIVMDSLTGEFGGGRLKATGTASMSGLSLQDFSSRVTFDSVTARYPEGLVATLSGDLNYDGDASQQSLTGDVAIKRARYERRVEWKSMLVDIGKSLYQRRKAEAGWIGETQINVRFYGSENILFQSNLAKIPLDVDVFLRGTVNHPQLLGRIEARSGSVYFRQSEFKIRHASVDFVDPNRMNPVVDVSAEIQVREYLVRLAVSGRADHAVVTLLSDPSLPDSDILALLALGKTSAELKGKEQGVGTSEAVSFATGPVQDLFESRARSLTGLDRFQVDPYIPTTGNTSVPRVTVGKEIIQDKLYVTYSSNVGSTMPEQVFRIEYILNKHFSLQGERNEELGNTGADIKYRFEFK